MVAEVYFVGKRINLEKPMVVAQQMTASIAREPFNSDAREPN